LLILFTEIAASAIGIRRGLAADVMISASSVFWFDAFSSREPSASLENAVKRMWRHA
jgi:hypothetical protein